MNKITSENFDICASAFTARVGLRVGLTVHKEIAAYLGVDLIEEISAACWLARRDHFSQDPSLVDYNVLAMPEEMVGEYHEVEDDEQQAHVGFLVEVTTDADNGPTDGYEILKQFMGALAIVLIAPHNNFPAFNVVRP